MFPMTMVMFSFCRRLAIYYYYYFVVVIVVVVIVVTLDNIDENRFVPDCSGVVTARAFVTVNLLIERFEMSVYYYYH